MPIYEFHCEHCRKDSEVLVRSSRSDGTKCPHCGSKKISKKLSVFSSGRGESSGPDVPACSGNPMACGRCDSGT